MDRLMERLKALQERPTLQLVMGLGGGIVVLFLVAVIGAFLVGDDGGTDLTADRGASSDETATSTTLPSEALGPAESTTTVAAGPGATTRKPGQPPVAVRGGSGIAKNDLVDTQGATRVGVTANSIRWGLHAPQTFDGQPLNLAEDPLKGVGIYLEALNAAGGVNGRKIDYRFADDRYTVEGGQTAAKKLINDDKVFFLSGTLGVDQIAQAAKLAREAKPFRVPYMAAGGSEEPFKDIGMFQIAGSYDTHLIKLAQYLGKLKNDSTTPYFGKTRVGVSRLDSPYIQPAVEKVFAKALQENGLQLVKTITVDKPTVETSYRDRILDMKAANVQIFVPAQDPITTGRMAAECKSQQCTWIYASSNFAHESDVALTLTQGEWTVPGRQAYALSGGCYYTSTSGNCGALGAARDQWVKARGQGDFNKDGQGGVAGYQVVHFWLKALTDIGPDPTREKLISAIANYAGFNDLVSSPITHKGSANFARGAESFVKFRATARPGPPESGNLLTWEQISDGFVSSF